MISTVDTCPDVRVSDHHRIKIDSSFSRTNSLLLLLCYSNCLSHEAALRCRTETWMLAKRIGWFFNHPQEAGWPAICFWLFWIQRHYGHILLMYHANPRDLSLIFSDSAFVSRTVCQKGLNYCRPTVFAVETASDLIQLWEPSPYCLGRRVAAPGGWYHVMFF